MSIETDLRAVPVNSLDLSEYTVVQNTATVRETIDKMRAEKHNCAFILDGEALAGVFTDRDVLNKVVDHPETWDSPITNIMTPNPSSTNAKDATGTGMQMMEQRRFRNVPVLDGEKVVGNLTHFAIIQYLAEQFPNEIYNLPPDPNKIGGRYGG